MPPSALVSTLVPASGVSHALFLPLTPATQHPLPARASVDGIALPTGRVLSNLVLARGRRLRVFEVREQSSPKGSDGKGIEGSGKGSSAEPPTIRLQHVLSHTVHGNVTGLGALRTLDSKKDGLSRLVVSYEEAKVRGPLSSRSCRNELTCQLGSPADGTPRVVGFDTLAHHSLTPHVRADSACRTSRTWWSLTWRDQLTNTSLLIVTRRRRLTPTSICPPSALTQNHGRPF